MYMCVSCDTNTVSDDDYSCSQCLTQFDIFISPLIKKLVEYGCKTKIYNNLCIIIKDKNNINCDLYKNIISNHFVKPPDTLIDIGEYMVTLVSIGLSFIHTLQFDDHVKYIININMFKKTILPITDLDLIIDKNLGRCECCDKFILTKDYENLCNHCFKLINSALHKCFRLMRKKYDNPSGGYLQDNNNMCVIPAYTQENVKKSFRLLNLYLRKYKDKIEANLGLRLVSCPKLSTIHEYNEIGFIHYYTIVTLNFILIPKSLQSYAMDKVASLGIIDNLPVDLIDKILIREPLIAVRFLIDNE
ncbi:hypothetical protein D6_00238 [Faustovirus]|nr:hypothetical protein D6_00238 [Faustovirus]